MKHVAFFSGGAGSEVATKRVIDEFGVNDTLLHFTDTLYEDKDLYRFLIESTAVLFNQPKPLDLIKRCNDIPDVTSDENMEIRKVLLPQLAKDTMNRLPMLTWLIDGRDIWEVFKKNRWIGNSSLAHCSFELKQDMSRRWIHENFIPDEVTLYVGIDWTEIHRMKAITENWKPYTVKAPMTEAPYQDKQDMMRELKLQGIKKPRLYELGFSHNNCSGACVKGGQAHWVNLLQTQPDTYRYMEQKEREMRDYLMNFNVTILTRTKSKVDENISLQQLRMEWDYGKGQQIDMLDFGGCGCFADYAS